MAVVELEALTKFFGTASAVDDRTLTVAHGSLCCLLGPSGCGKTTTLRLVAGFIDPARGTIPVGGGPPSPPGAPPAPRRGAPRGRGGAPSRSGAAPCRRSAAACR